MRTFLLIIFAASSFVLYAQTIPLTLEMKHFLKGEKFILDESIGTENGLDYKIERLDYLVSGITVYYADGTSFPLSDVYLFINPTIETFDLGQVPAGQIVSIDFNIGVPRGINNENPAQWPSGHALAPRSPTMHWGWAAGYRFMAIEGNALAADGTFSEIFECHIVGDNFYTAVSTPVFQTANQVRLGLRADYDTMLKNIYLPTLDILHGDFPIFYEIMANMADSTSPVFSPLAVSSTSSLPLNNLLLLSPNPVSDLLRVADFPTTSTKIQFQIVNQVGQTVLSQDHQSIDTFIDIQVGQLPPGLYFINVFEKGKIVAVQRFVKI